MAYRARAYGPSIELKEELVEKTPEYDDVDSKKDEPLEMSSRLKGVSKYVKLDPDAALASIPDQIRGALAAHLGRTDLEVLDEVEPVLRSLLVPLLDHPRRLLCRRAPLKEEMLLGAVDDRVGRARK